MADPATLTLITRAAIAATADKRTWKVFGVIIAALLTPVILIVVVILSLLSATANHNNAAIDLAFHGGTISSQMPADYANRIRDMRDSFSKLDVAIADICKQLEGGSLDNTRVKAIFYALFFGAESISMDSEDYRAFVDCFVRYETQYDKEKGMSSTVAIPLTSLPKIYAKLENTLGKRITNEDRANASEIYNRILYGDIPTEGDGLQNWINTITAGSTDVPFIGGDFISPLGSNWRGMVDYRRLAAVLYEKNSCYSLSPTRRPRGYAQVEIEGSKGRLIAQVKNLRPLHGKSPEGREPRYQLRIIGERDGKVIPVNVGIFKLNRRGMGEIRWEVDPLDIGGTGLAIDDLTSVEVIVQVE